MKKIKILLIANYKLGVGGISGQVELLHKYLNREEGYAVDIYSLKGNPIKRIILIFRLLFVGKKYDVFHIHGCSGWGFLPVVYGVSVGKFLSKRIVVTYHGGGADSFFDAHRNLVRYFLNRADYVVVLSGFLKSIFDKYNIKNITIPNILEFSDEQYKRRNEIRPNFISIRSLRKLYNIKCIIKAFEIVKLSIDNAGLVLLGDGDCRAELEQYVKEKNIDNVTFIGAVPNNQVYSYLEKSDVLLSSPIIDNMPVSILEAYNAGLLVISSCVGGVPYILEDAKTGYLFESDNEKELAEKMILAVSNQLKSLEIISNAKNEVVKYSWENIRLKIFELYK